MSGKADALVLLDHSFFAGGLADGVTCLYTDGEAGKNFTASDELIKHIVAAREDLLQQPSVIEETLSKAFRAWFAYRESHLAEIADAFVARYRGDKEALLASARYPRIEFTFTEKGSA